MKCVSVLIIEDDQDIRESMVELLQAEGHATHQASNGKEGLKILRGLDKPCLVLLDLMMPVMNGFEFLEILKQDVRLAATPVVIVSAVVDRHMAIGASGFIKKPLDVDTLLAVVDQYCR